MTNTLDKITTDFNNRFNRLKQNLEYSKDWTVLNRVLNLSEMSCWRIFKKANISLEDVEDLYSMMVNCLLDDSCFVISVDGSRLHVTWGSDDATIVVKEDHLNAMMDILEESEKFYDLHKEALNYSRIDRKVILDYISFDAKLEDLMLSLATEEIKKSYTPKFKK